MLTIHLDLLDILRLPVTCLSIYLLRYVVDEQNKKKATSIKSLIDPLGSVFPAGLAGRLICFFVFFAPKLSLDGIRASILCPLPVSVLVG